MFEFQVNYVVQEAIVVIKDIFRKYPNKYESIISTLCENLDTLDEPEARASMIWIIGEYAERIDNADELLESFLEGFADENSQVQLQLLTAIVKLFLKRPSDTQELVQQVRKTENQVIQILNCLSLRC
jgi:vesicle coat complex subunit